MLLGVALQSRGLHERALNELEASFQAHARALGTDHALTVLYGINRAASMVALGDPVRALTLIDAAMPVLRHRLGAAAPVVQRAERLRFEIAARRRGESTEAASTAFFL